MPELTGWTRKWRSALVAAVVSIVAGLPGLISLPPVDAGETLTAQSTVQMLETGDFTTIRFQQEIQEGSAPGAHWAQAISAAGTGGIETRPIWAFRLPSLLAVALTAAISAWAVTGLFGARAGLLAGVFIGLSALGISLSAQATPAALYTAAMALCLAGLSRMHLRLLAGERPGWRTKGLFWAGIGAGFLISGPMTFFLPFVAIVSVSVWERRFRWILQIGWTWGLLLLTALVGGWIAAAAVATDGQALGFTPIVSGEGFGLGRQTAIAPLLMFPVAFTLPFAVWTIWKRRREPSVSLLAGWLIPGWLILEVLPGFSIHGASAVYVALFWLASAGFSDAAAPAPVRASAAGLTLFSGAALAILSVWLVTSFGAGPLAALLPGSLAIAAALGGSLCVLRTNSRRFLAMTLALGLAAQWSLMTYTAPRLDGLWPTRAALAALGRAGLDPRNGLARGPVAIAGLNAPGAVLALGARTHLGDGEMAAAAIADGRAAIVEAREGANFNAELARRGVRAQPRALIDGHSLADGGRVTLTVYGPLQEKAPPGETPDGAE